MARPSQSSELDLSRATRLTVGAIERLTCPPGKSQTFLRDVDGNGLRVRVTAAGAKSFVFEQSLNGRTIRRTLGSVTAHSIAAAQLWAKEQSALIDRGHDPRELDRMASEQRARAMSEAEAQASQEAADRIANAVTVGAVWQRYLAERQPKWSARTYADHLKMTSEGGEDRVRRPKVKTKPGPLATFMAFRLVDLTPAEVETWAVQESKVRPARVRLALRMLKAFLRWAAAEPDLKGRADPSAASARKAREAAGRSKPKNDYLMREQLPSWFKHVRAISNPVIAAYLQCLLLTGARREELAGLRWADINWQWRGLRIADKVEDSGREIPLTPYVAKLLAGLPRRNDWVFSSARDLGQDSANQRRRERYHARRGTAAPTGTASFASESGRMVEPSIAHRRACVAAGLEGLTLHGLRRSFASLSEWLDVPVGVVAQIMGHKPSAIAERHYKRRPLDLLRLHHARIETWVLAEAGIEWPEKSETADASSAQPANRHGQDNPLTLTEHEPAPKHS